MSLVAMVVLVSALLSAALMGMAIQRGATCLVVAIDEALTHRAYARALAIGEAALWVGGLLAIAQLAGALKMYPALYAATGWTVLGGMLLGIGAWVNKSCVFGSIAKIGSGQWAWLATPPGYFLGSLFALESPASIGHPEPFANAGLVALAFGVLLLWRLVEAARAPDLFSHLWHPHRATLIIAITFASTLLTVGLWAYTDALAALAHSMDAVLGLRSIMVIALLLGATAGGWFAGKLKWERPALGLVLRCLGGGALMGFGGSLVPGSNDGLIMVGLPLLQPHAWLAVAAMALSIAACITLSSWLGGRAAAG